MKHTVVHEREVQMRTSNNFSSNIFGGESRPQTMTPKQMTRIESNKNFKSEIFSTSNKTNQSNRVTNSIQGHDIFNNGSNTLLTNNSNKDKQVSIRYNNNHGGQAIFQDKSTIIPPKQREVKTLQDSNIFGVSKQSGTVQKMSAQKTKVIRVTDNHVNQVIPTDQHQDNCSGRNHAQKTVHQPDFVTINAKDMKAQEFHGMDQLPQQPKVIKKTIESNLDARMRKITDNQCSDIFNTDKNYALKQKERRQAKQEDYNETAFSRNQKDKHSSTIFDQSARSTNTEVKVKLQQQDKDNADKRQHNHQYSDLFGNEHSSAPTQKKPTTIDHMADWKYHNEEMFMTQEEKNKVQKEFENLDCKQKKYRELTSHLENNGSVQDSVLINKEEKYKEKFDKLEDTEFKVEKGGKKETTDLKKKMQTHHQIHSDYQHSAKEKVATKATIYEYNVKQIPEGYDEHSFKKFCSSEGIQLVKFDVNFNYLNNQMSGDAKMQLRCKNDNQSKTIVNKLKQEGFTVQEFKEKSQKIAQTNKDTAKMQGTHRTIQAKPKTAGSQRAPAKK